MLVFTRSSVLFSLNCLAATLLALLIGFWLDLPRPYWAVLTIYIVSQPLTGSVRSKALFRVVGTFLGAAFAVLVVPPLVDAPVLLILAMAAWVGLCLTISLLDRTPRAYVVMLAGYTATLVAFPTVDHPDQIFDIAVSRVEEITLGILCATLTHSLIFPHSLGLALRQRLTDWVRQADEWAHDVLRRDGAETMIKDYRHLAAAATEIRLLSVLLPFDTSHLRQTSGVVRALHQRLLVLIPILSGVDDRLIALREQRGGEDPDVATARSAIGEWIAAGAGLAEAEGLLERIRAWKAARIGADWRDMLRESLFLRLADLVVNLGEAHALMECLQTSPTPLPADLAHAVQIQADRPLHRDLGLAIVSGLSAALTIMVVCAIWILTAWPEGTVAAAIAGVFCALFASLDDPASPIATFGWFSGLAIPIVALYQFAILPSIDGFVMLAVVLIPPFFLAGVAMTQPKTALPGLAFALGFASALALQETFSVDFASFLNINTAQYVSLFIAIVITRTMRSLSVQAAARRLLVRNWKTLASVARDHGRLDQFDFAAIMVDRLGLLTPRLAAFGPDERATGLGALTDLRIGMNLAHLRQHESAFDPAQQAAADTVLARVGGYYADRAAGRTSSPDAQVLAALDACLAATANAADRDGVSALVGLRRNLFPGASGFSSTVASGGS